VSIEKNYSNIQNKNLIYGTTVWRVCCRVNRWKTLGKQLQYVLQASAKWKVDRIDDQATLVERAHIKAYTYAD
jgi:hypothetical protein